MEFKHEDGKIYCKIYGSGDYWFDVTEEVMPVVDNYLDYHLDLKYGTNWASNKK
jgi:hypothetical protein